jgi:chromosome segregation ATPase
MNEESKKMEAPSFSLHPLLGLDLGERWGREIGELSNRVTHLENSVSRLEAKFDLLDAKVDKMAQAIHRLDERISGVEARLDAKIDGLGVRMGSLEKRFDDPTKLMWGFFLALLAAIIAQRLI